MLWFAGVFGCGLKFYGIGWGFRFVLDFLCLTLCVLYEFILLVGLWVVVPVRVCFEGVDWFI